MKRKVELPIQYVKLRDKWNLTAKKDQKAPTAAMRYGKAYEKTFLDYLCDRYPQTARLYWLEFEDANGVGFAQPDAMVWDPLIVFEVKTRFSYRKAYAELKTLYGPLVKHLAKGREPKLVQVCKYLSPSARHTTVVQTLKEVIESDKKLLTLQWRPL